MTKVRKKVLRLNNDLENVLNQEVKWKKIFYIRHNLLLTKSWEIPALVTTINLSTAECSKFTYILWRLLKAILVNEVIPQRK